MGTATTARFRRTVAYQPLPSAYTFHTRQERFRGFSGPVGSGKSAALAQEAVKQAYLNHGCLGLIGAPTYRMLADVTRAAILRVLEENRIPHRFEKSENAVELHEPASRIIFRSLDEPTRLVGTNLAWFGCDELTYSKEDSWRRLEARLREPRARCLTGFGVWTPKGFDWVYQRFLGPNKVDGYFAVCARPRENRHLPSDFYDRLKSSYDPRFYQQEAEGQYLSVFSGAVYYNFDRAVHVTPLDFDPRFGLCWALDFNIDPMCSILSQVIDTTTREEQLRGRQSYRVHVLDEIILPDSRTVDAVRVFLERIAPYLTRGLTSISVFGDASGNNRHSSALKSDWQLVREILRRELSIPVHFRIPEANPPVRERVTAFCSLLRNAAGAVQMYLDPRVKELTMDLEQVAWKRDAAGNPTGDIDKSNPRRTHSSDALGYQAYKLRRPQGGLQSSPLL